MQAHDTLSTRVSRSQTPYVVACASQLVHCPHVCALVVITPAYPWPHRHDPDPAGESLLAGQAVHWFGRSVAVKVPMPHAPHAADDCIPLPVENDPAPHRPHAAEDCIPVPVENVPAPHAPHVDEAEAPTAELYVPAPHAAHDVEPASEPYAPAQHLPHTPLLA